MAYAIASGMVRSGVIEPARVFASARTNTRLATVWKDLGTGTSTNNLDVMQNADVVFLCVKPHLLPGVLDEIAPAATSEHLFVSVAAGVTIEFMEGKLPAGSRVVRTMPNTPCLVQSGVVVYACGSTCREDDGSTVQAMLQTTGLVEEVDENQIDSVSAIMGCSPAWYYMVLEAMSDGAVKCGVPRLQSYRFAAKAMEGAAKMVLETGKHPGQLKDEVTSPNGSTICGVFELEQAGMRGMFMKAVQSAAARNRELGQNK